MTKLQIPMQTTSNSGRKKRKERLNKKKCHSKRSEESEFPNENRFFAMPRMTSEILI